jgi:uncharacterized membrane protein YdjX (TVP38/TMEM64 family)
VKKIRSQPLSKSEKMRVIRLIIFAIVITEIVILSIKLFGLVNNLSDEAYRLDFKEKVSSMGFIGVLLVLGLQIVQIFVAVIPGQPVEIISGMLYGTYLGVAICSVGIFLGTALVYFTVKRIGTDIMELFFKPEDIEKTKNMKMFKDTAKLEIFLVIIFLIPAIPKDIFIYLGAVTNIKPKRFLLISTIPRIPGLFLTVYAGSALTNGSYTVAIIVAAIIAAFAIVGILINRKIQK